MKAYTDIKQSKKLAEILPIKSADMWFHPYPNDEYWYNVPNIGNADLKYNQLPCWSLVALLDIFPCSKESPIVNLTRGGWIPTTSNFTRLWFATWEDENKNIFYSCNGVSPVDAVVRLILKLHKQKLL